MRIPFWTKRLEERNLAFQNKLLAKQVEEVQNIYMTMRGWRHDYHNHLQAMKAYVQLGQYSQLEHYLQLLEEDLEHVNQMIETGNVNLDAVLNSKLSYAQMKGIEVNRADVAASFQKAVCDVLVEHAMLAVKESGLNKLAIAGGVASNGTLRMAMEQACAENGIRFYRPSPIFCTDNAAMIGAAGYYEYMQGTRSGYDLNAVPNLKLGER